MRGDRWQKLGISPPYAQALADLGLLRPTDIQKSCIVQILKREGDVVAQSSTGSGKTLAYVAPIVNVLGNHCKLIGARCLIVVPTRELSLQVNEVVKNLVKKCSQSKNKDGNTTAGFNETAGLLTDGSLRTCLIVGGNSLMKQFDYLANNPDIIIATPGRLIQALSETKYKLSRLRFLVFDEADELFDNTTMNQDLSFIIDQTSRGSKLLTSELSCQMILCSATLPTKVVDFTRLNFRNPAYLSSDDHQLSKRISLNFLYMRFEDKLACLLYWLDNIRKPGSQLMLFCSTVHHVHLLSAVLSKCKFTNSVLSGKIDQITREESIDAFKKRSTDILITTDVAARGLDISNLDYVFNFDFPSTPKLFVHRSGRTARGDIHTGTVVSFVTHYDVQALLDLVEFMGYQDAMAALTSGNKNNPPIHIAKTDNFSECEFEIDPQLDCCAVQDDETKIDSAASTIISGFIGGANEDDKIILAGFPGIDNHRSRIYELCSRDPEIEKLYDTMKNGYKHYLKWRSRYQKKYRGIDVKNVLNGLGGPTKIADTPHPIFQKVKVYDSLFPKIKTRSLDDILGLDRSTFKTEDHGTIKSQSEETDIDSLRTVRPAKTRQSALGLGINYETHMLMVNEKMRRSELSRILDNQSLGQLLESSGKCRPPKILAGHRGSNDVIQKLLVSVETEPVMTKTKCKRKSSDFYIDVTKSVQDEGLEMSNLKKMRRETMDIIPDAEDKLRHVNRWNSEKKRYEVTAIDATTGVRVGARRIRNDSGVKVDAGYSDCRGLYEKWKKLTDRRIQGPGETEDDMNMAMFIQKQRLKYAAPEEEPNHEDALEIKKHTIFDMVGRRVLKEKVKRGMKMTKKEARQYHKLSKMVANPINTTPMSAKAPMTKARRKWLKQRENENKKKHRVPDAEYRKQHLEKLQKTKGRPTKSIIIRKTKKK